MNEHKILPFYMTYPLMEQGDEKGAMWKDLEYLQQMYPMGAKILQNEINKCINKYDYRGSMIYDEYPDRLLLYKIGQEVLSSLRRNKDQHQGDAQYLMLLEWDGIEEFVMVLLFYEILRRRHRNPRMRYDSEE
ncbi:MAG: hypothetical protein IJ711_02160 [Lachnospiraceae bacterium]|nr:hypothetical protein [Lachnospiraceae bacterium]